MSLIGFIKGLIEQWERGITDADDVVRQIRDAIAEEEQINATS